MHLPACAWVSCTIINAPQTVYIYYTQCMSVYVLYTLSYIHCLIYTVLYTVYVCDGMLTYTFILLSYTASHCFLCQHIPQVQAF